MKYTPKLTTPLRLKGFEPLCYVILATLCLALIARAASGQTLNEAIIEQLGFGPLESTACFELLDGAATAPEDVLTGPLLSICERSVPSPGPGPSEATGGSTATPNTLPSIIQKRIREARGENIQPVTPGASADAVVEYANGLGVFVSLQFGQLDRDMTSFEAGYDSNLWRLTAGTDYQVSRSILVGLAVDYTQHDGLYQGGGGFRNDTYGLLGFASFLPMDDVFVQIEVGWALTDYDRNRFAALIDMTEEEFIGEEVIIEEEIILVASGAVKSNYLSHDFRAGVLAGYDYDIGDFTIGLRAGFNWLQRHFGNYREEGDTGLELQFYKDDQTLLQSRVGLLAAVALRTTMGVIVPQADINWKHEFENDQREVQVSFVGDLRAKRFSYLTESPDRDWFEIGAGITAVLPYGLQVFGSYRTMIGHKFFDSHLGTIGLRASL